MSATTTLRVIGVQHPAGRQHEHVLVFGYRESDAARRVVLVPVTVADAVALIEDGQAKHEFPVIEVPDWSWAHCLNTGGVKMVHFTEPGAGA